MGKRLRRNIENVIMRRNVINVWKLYSKSQEPVTVFPNTSFLSLQCSLIFNINIFWNALSGSLVAIY
jgi:hypothetical protein